MIRVIAIDKDGKECGESRLIEDYIWENLQKFGKRLRWKKLMEVYDTKPNMEDYDIVKGKAMEYFKEENWEKSLYYFEAAHRLKSFSWITGKINKCKKNIKGNI